MSADVTTSASPRINGLGWTYYFRPDTEARGRELGLDLFSFYFLGRGGALGDVDAPAVISAFGYFKPDVVTKLWDRARAKVDPRTAALEHWACAAGTGRQMLGDLDGLGEFCAAAEVVADAADPVGLALYAGFATLPLAEDLPARAMQLVAVLREYRGSAHLCALRAVGVDGRTAHAIKRPNDWAMFGWAEEDRPAVTDDQRRAMDEAEALTDRIVAPAYGALDDDGARHLLAGLDRIEPALTGQSPPAA